jgi:hypothetical protein
MPDDTGETAGEQLAERVRELTARRGHAPAWLPAFELVRTRAAGLPTPQASPRRRVEADVPLHLPLDMPAPSWPAGPPAPPTHSAEPSTAPDPAAGLPADVRQRLRGAVGAEVGHLVVRTDDRADALAREHRADAVTVGHEIHFRTDRYRPAEPGGFALLAHEAWHATADQRGGTDHRATDRGAAAEEHHARAVERQVLGGAAHPVPPAHRAAVRPHATPPAPATAAPATPAARPMAAAEDRDVHTAPDGASPALDLAALRAELLRDVLREVRTDLDRGA